MATVSNYHREAAARHLSAARTRLAEVKPPEGKAKPVPSSSTRVPLATSGGEIVDVDYDAAPAFRHGLELLAATGTEGPRARLPYRDAS